MANLAIVDFLLPFNFINGTSQSTKKMLPFAEKRRSFSRGGVVLPMNKRVPNPQTKGEVSV